MPVDKAKRAPIHLTRDTGKRCCFAFKTVTLDGGGSMLSQQTTSPKK